MVGMLDSLPPDEGSAHTGDPLQRLAREREARLIAERATARLQQLQAITSALIEANTPEQVADIVVGHASVALDAAMSALYMLDQDGRDFALVASRDLRFEKAAGWKILPMDADLPLPVAIRNGQPIWFEDRERLVSAYPYLRRTVVVPAEQVQALAALPLRAGGHTVGGLLLTFATPHAFDREEREFIWSFVTQCGLALERIRLYEAEREARSQAEAMVARLRESEERFRLTVAHAPIGKALVGLDGRFLLVNQALSDLLGYTPEELVRLRFQDVTHPEDLAADLGLAQQLLEGKIPRYQLEKRYIRKDGSLVDIVLHGSLVRDEAGQPVHFIAQVVDVSERKRAEREQARLVATLESERRWLQQVIERMPAGVVLFEGASAGGPRIVTNRRMEELLGRPLDREGGVRQYLGQICEVNGRPLAFEELPSTRAFHGELVSGAEYLVQRRDGRRTPVRVSTAVLRDALGALAGVIGVFDDITALKNLERLREEWTSVIAHDLRNEVGTISFAAQLGLKAQELGSGEKVVRDLDRIRASARQLDRMVVDLLDVSRIEARRLKLVPAAVELRALVVEAVERLGHFTRENPVRVEQRNVSGPVWADAGRIDQVLSNLLSNAVKYGEPGAEILIELEGRAEEVEVTVTNRGRGIDPHELSRLFNRFTRSEQTRTSKVPGLGLGLYICKGLIEAHGGRIWAESTPGDRTRFHFTLPLASARRPAG